MKVCDLTFWSPAENLAFDEALLESCESGAGDEVLRFWEPRKHFVVVGYGNRVQSEVNLTGCKAAGIPVFRRCSGGGAVLQGPGCLNYALVLRTCHAPALQSISGTNRYVLERHATSLSELMGTKLELKGHTDLAFGAHKFSGNSQRRRKATVLFHGCFLLGLDIGLMESVLCLPSIQPDYRANRPHAQFVKNLIVPAERIKAALIKTWNAGESMRAVPRVLIDKLLLEKYAIPAWNLR